MELGASIGLAWLICSGSMPW